MPRQLQRSIANPPKSSDSQWDQHWAKLGQERGWRSCCRNTEILVCEAEASHAQGRAKMDLCKSSNATAR